VREASFPHAFGAYIVFDPALSLRPRPGAVQSSRVNWESATWRDFERALIEYRDREYLGRSRISGENAYLALFEELARVPIAAREAHLDSLVLFLNRWNCHFPTRTSETRNALRGWLQRERESLEALVAFSLTDADLAERRGECERLYSSLIALRDSGSARIPTMGDAAASKILHLMIPPLFVMWDKEIKKAGWRYGEFMAQMNTFALHLRDALAPAEARPDIEDYLQTALGYPIKKPLAKYIDEYNWWLAWGLGAIAADTSAPSTT
jgi:hypothetical protein